MPPPAPLKMVDVFYVPTMTKHEWVRNVKKYMKEGDTKGLEEWAKGEVRKYIQSGQKTLAGDVIFTELPSLIELHVLKLYTPGEVGYAYVDKSPIDRRRRCSK